jgi:hypothetical protein
MGVAVALVLALGACGDSGKNTAKTTETTPHGSTGSTGSAAAGGSHAGSRSKAGSGSGAGSKTGSGPSSNPEKLPKGRLLRVYVEAQRVCATGPPDTVARSIGSKSTDPRAIARKLAHGYLPRLRKAAYRGCLDVLK